MKNIYKTSSLLFAICAISFLQACQKENQFRNELRPVENSRDEHKFQDFNTFNSSTLPIGNGVVRAWVSVNKEGEPVAVGIKLSEKALDNLPADPAQYVLLLPKNKGKNFYTHVLIDWNPQGHEPAHVYDVPHFDFHFYIIPNEQRMAIGPNDVALFANAPASQYVPALYLQTPGGVPQMGAHWIDLLSPEFNGGIFTKTFIWGSYNGNFIFWEPMVTRDYLLSHPNDLVTLRQPSAFQRDGYYATQYSVSYSASPKEYNIVLLNLVHREGE